MIDSQQMNDITDTVMLALKAQYPDGIDQASVSMTLIALGTKLLSEYAPSQDIKPIVLQFVKDMDLDDITGFRIDN